MRGAEAQPRQREVRVQTDGEFEARPRFFVTA
jgi:hypothetical protein